MSQHNQSREGFFGFLDGVRQSAENIAGDFFAAQAANNGRTEQTPPANSQVTDADAARAASANTIAGVSQSTILLGFGGLIVVLLLARS